MPGRSRPEPNSQRSASIPDKCFYSQPSRAPRLGRDLLKLHTYVSFAADEPDWRSNLSFVVFVAIGAVSRGIEPQNRGVGNIEFTTSLITEVALPRSAAMHHLLLPRGHLEPAIANDDVGPCTQRPPEE